jgi:hypothetical protein
LWKFANRHSALGQQFAEIADCRINVISYNLVNFDDHCIENVFLHELLHCVAFYSLLAQQFNQSYAPQLTGHVSVLDRLAKMSLTQMTLQQYIIWNGMQNVAGEDVDVHNVSLYNPPVPSAASSLSHVAYPNRVMSPQVHNRNCLPPVVDSDVLVVLRAVGWDCQPESTSQSATLFSANTHLFDSSHNATSHIREEVIPTSDQLLLRISIVEQDKDASSDAGTEWAVAMAFIIICVILVTSALAIWAVM